MFDSLLYIVIPILFLPLWILLLGHPWKVVRFISKSLLFLSVFGVITGLPILLIIKLNYWIVLLIGIIIAFRAIDVLVNKLDFSKFSSVFNGTFVFRLTSSSFISIMVIFLTLEKSPWFGLWFAFFFFMFMGTGLYRFTQKFKLVYGAFFGFIVFLFPYNGFNVNSVITLGFSFTITLLLMLVLNKVTKRKIDEKYQVVGLGTIILLSLYLLNAGGMPMVWAPLISSTFIFILVNVLVLYGNDSFSKLELPKVLKHYFVPILMVVIVATITYFMNKFSIFKGMIQSSMGLIYLEGIVLVAGRVFAPVMNNYKDSDGKPYIDYILEVFTLMYGKTIGSRIYKTVYGEYYKEISTWIGFLFAGMLIGAFGTYFTLTFSSNPISRAIITESIVSTLLFTSFTSGLSFFSEVSTVATSKGYEKGMPEDKAIHSSTIIIANYAMTILPFILLKIPDLRDINVYFAVFVAIEIILYIFTINWGLFEDFKEQQYNALYVTRKRVTIFLVFIGVMTTAGYLFCIYNTNREAPINTFMLLILIPFVSAFLARLIGYDNAISGEKVHTQYAKTARSLVLYFVLYAFTIKGMPIVYQYLSLITKDQSIAKNIVNIYLKVMGFGNIFILEQLFFSLAIAVLPKTNNLKDGLFKLAWSKDTKRNYIAE